MYINKQFFTRYNIRSEALVGKRVVREKGGEVVSCSGRWKG